MYESDLDYFAKADLGRYAGKWIALLGNKIIAVGKNFKEVAEEVDRKHLGGNPLLSKVPEKMAQIL